MKATSFLFAASLIGQAAAFWRMNCPSRLLNERADPIISPGQVSSHVHGIVGGNAFGFSMGATEARKSTCSTCPIKQDMSNYWAPTLYFHAPNGSFIAVPQTGDYSGMLAGMAVYYLQRGGPNNDKLKAFPEGFRMAAGDPFKRVNTSDFASQAISFACLDYNGPQSAYEKLFPQRNCPQGMRLQIFFPSCWDGKNLDSPDHKSHMSYPSSWSFDSGPCPASHPVHLVSIFYEVNYDTGRYADLWTPDGKNQPFVLSTGDPTGAGFHGDFINGWDVPTLQRAIDECTDDSGQTEVCHVFGDLTPDDECLACKIPPSVQEDLLGPMPKLPGCNPIQAGPQQAVQHTDCAGVTSTISKPSEPFVDWTRAGWEYVGCAQDSVMDRTLKGANAWNDTETIRKCLNYCESKGYQYAGAEYSTQCYCDNTLRQDRAPGPTSMGQCTMKCGGSNAMCGGGGALSLYRRCNGQCKNASWSPINPSNLGRKQSKRDPEYDWDPEGALTYDEAVSQGLVLAGEKRAVQKRSLKKRDNNAPVLDDFTALSKKRDELMGMLPGTDAIERSHARDFSQRMY